MRKKNEVKNLLLIIFFGIHFSKIFFLKKKMNDEKRPKNLHENESRFVVEILRHKLDFVKHDQAGYVSFDDLLIYYTNNKKKKVKTLTLDKMLLIAEFDKRYDKQRMDLKLENSEYFVRANQGHTSGNIDEYQIFEEILKPLDFCIHGTEKKFIDSIVTNGLSKMGRTHIHCINANPNDKLALKAVLSGFKKQSNCVLIIDMAATMSNGMKWYKSKNNVLLTQGPIDSKFFIVQDL
jgi:2'-phosphotransferase